MEKYVKKSVGERLTGLAVVSAIGTSSLIGAAKLGSLADKAEKEGKTFKSGAYNLGSSVCSCVAITAAIILPKSVLGALNGTKVNPEYKKKVEEINSERCLRYMEAEDQYQKEIKETVFNAEIKYQDKIRKADIEANEKLLKL